MDPGTRRVYEAEGARYAIRRGIQDPAAVRRFVDTVGQRGPVLDLGCGPGHYTPLLGPAVVGLDGAWSMVCAARAEGATVVHADLTGLPFDAASFAGVFASKAHQHLRAHELPLALAEVHRCLRVGGRLHLVMFGGDDLGPHGFRTDVTTSDHDDLPGRRFTLWSPPVLRRLLVGAGFGSVHIDDRPSGDGVVRLVVRAERLRSLPDYVGSQMRILFCGLNPSLRAADAGVGYVTASNRFWSALRAANLASLDRDPRRLLTEHGLGMTDLVKRATPRAADLETSEYGDGLRRLKALVAWLKPGAVVMVGLSGWRAAVDSMAVAGWQSDRLAGVATYVMPSTSGLNAGSSFDDLVGHLRAVADRV